MGNNNEAAEADNRQTGHMRNGIDEACNEEIDRSESQFPKEKGNKDNENPDDLKIIAA